MPPPHTERLHVRARRPAGVSTLTFSFEREGSVLGHAVLRRRHRGERDRWFVTDREAPPFVVEDTVVEGHRTWLLARPDGAPFGRIEVVRRRPLDVAVLDGTDHLVRVTPDGTLRAPDDGSRLGRISLPDEPDQADGAILELPTGIPATLRAALLTLPLCVLPASPSLRSDLDR
jgi:hypothetical protein